MTKVTISNSFEVEIPPNIREALKLKPGQNIQIIMYGDRIELIPEKKIQEMRGFLKGINTDNDRDGDRY